MLLEKFSLHIAILLLPLALHLTGCHERPEKAIYVNYNPCSYEKRPCIYIFNGTGSSIYINPQNTSEHIKVIEERPGQIFSVRITK